MAEPAKRKRRKAWVKDCSDCSDQKEGSIKHSTQNKPSGLRVKHIMKKKVVQIIEVSDIDSEYSPSEDVETIRTKSFEQEKQRAHQLLEKRIQMIRTEYRQIHSALVLVEGFLNDSGHDDASKASGLFLKGRYLISTAIELIRKMEGLENGMSEWDVQKCAKFRKSLANNEVEAVQLLSSMGKWKRKATYRDVSLIVTRSY